MRSLPIAAAAALLTAGAVAQGPQHSIVFALDSDELTLLNGNGLAEAGLLREDELGFVTPIPGFYSASTFLSQGTQWAYLGDADSDGRYADDSVEAPGDDVDALLVKRFPSAPTGPFSPRQIYISKETVEGFGPGIEDGDVFRYAGPAGAIEIFVKEDDLLLAIGQLTTSDLDTDAICQTDSGDLLVSFADNELVNSVTANDGALIFIPASAITYDVNFNVSAITAGSAVIVAEETHFQAFVAASGMLTSVGGLPGTSVNELTALEIDPNGGTWTTPLGGSLTLPNILFAWQGFSNDGALISTAGGGSIPLINGVPMASAVATTGTQIGMLPTSTGIFGVNGLAIIPFQPAPMAIENYPRNLITSLPSWHRVEASNCTPFGTVVFIADLGPTATGGALTSFDVPPYGELFIGAGGVVLTFTIADADGFADWTDILVSPTLVGQNAVFQVFDVGTALLSAPAALQFL